MAAEFRGTLLGVIVWVTGVPLQVCTAVAPGNALVLYNQASPDGLAIANYYAQAHPGVQLLGLSGVSTAEEITADEYLTQIAPQVRAALAASTQVIVTTKGLPLRIQADSSYPGYPAPYSYTDPFGVQRTIYSSTWKQYSSLESELTKIDTIGANGASLATGKLQMGDQTWWVPPLHPAYPQQSRNLYYQASGAFDPAKYQMRLTARLDAFSVADVKASIDRAQHAVVTDSAHWIVLDDYPTKYADDLMPNLKNNVLEPRGQAYVYESTTAAAVTAPGPVIGYVSHGVNNASGPGALVPGYIANQLDFSLANGAVFHTYESFNAYSFVAGNNVSGQGLIGEWLQIGGTAGVGHVYEPYSGNANVANEDQMFRMLLSGYTWAEAAWSSLQQVSYVNTVVGDPLMVWKHVTPANSDWAANSDGKWSTPGNWSAGVPNGPGATANFTGNSPATVDVDVPATIGRVIFSPNDGSLSYCIGGATSAALKMDNTGGAGGPAASIGATAGSHTIASQVVTTSASDLDVSATAGGSLNLSGGIDNTAAKIVTLTQTGAGTLRVGDITNDGAGLLSVAGGAVSVGNISGTGTTSVAAGASLTADSIVQTSLTIGAGGSVTISPANPLNSIWTTNSDGKWTTPGNWSAGVPDGPGAAAQFTGNAPALVNVDGMPKTVGRLLLSAGAVASYTIGSGTDMAALKMDNTGGAGGPAASIGATAGSHTIASQVVTTSASDLDVSATAGGSLNLSGGIDNTAAKIVTLTQTGAGTLAVGDIVNAGPGVLTVTNNSTVSAGDISGTGDTSVGANASLAADSIVQTTLTIGAGGSVTIRPVVVAGAGSSAVPEPATWVLLLTAALGWLVFRRRR